ncbi:peptidoglycan-recognition protein 2-like [Bacillus rossius redtenbacheri]|uniref:peptidoglycan-recognition protein 2-like n=1 Tax=Bacillus rossius redtenbacheri TaxID=93214 RepID=UPI002FDE7433
MLGPGRLAAVPHVVVACLALCAAHKLRASCPDMVTRAEWGARNPQGAVEPLAVSPAPFVVIHHGGTRTYCTTQAECSRVTRGYQNYHMDTQGWADIGYNFLVGEDGRVYEARGWDRTGAHAPPFNNQSVGICVIGDFSDRLPNEAAMRALQQLVWCGVQKGELSAQYGLLGHRQARPTLCPGDALYRAVAAMPRWVALPRPQLAAASTTTSPAVNSV